MSETQYSDKIKINIQTILNDIKNASKDRNVEIVAVSKNQSIDRIRAAYTAGLRHFGENRGQELRDKNEFFRANDGVKLSFIGVLQKNKIKYLVESCTLIQSIDSLPLASYVNEKFMAAGKKIDVLLEVNSSGEYAKSGFKPDEMIDAANAVMKMQFLNLKGVMTIGPLSGGIIETAKSFKLTAEIFKEIKSKHEELSILSMGMSDDYLCALENGSNMIRIGRKIFE